jgi:uncharacterized protein (DUF952 family)
MTKLFHITDKATWAAAVQAGEYRQSTRDLTLEEQGYIHCSLLHQVRGVAERLYSDRGDSIVLVIDSSRLQVPIRYEAPTFGGERYPHVYGAIPVDAVTEVIEGRLWEGLA